MNNLKKISVVFTLILLVSMLFVSCDKLKKSDEVVEIKAEKVATQEPEKVSPVTQEKKTEPEVIVVGAQEAVQETVEEVVAVAEEKAEETAKAVVEVEEKTETKVEEAVAALEAKVEETTAVVETKAEEVVAVVEEKTEQVVQAAETKVEEVAVAVEAKVEETAAVVETKTEEAAAKVEEKVEQVTQVVEAKVEETPVFNPPAVPSKTPAKVPAKTKAKAENSIGVEIGAGASYYRLEYRDYKADMFKLSIPLYFHIPAGDSFTVSAYAKPAYLKELQKDAKSSSLSSTQNFSLDFGLGLAVHNEKFELEVDCGLDLFNEGKKLKDDPYAMLNAQIVPSFRLGNSSLWLSIPFEGSISPKTKHNRAYGAGICLTLRTDIK